MCDPHEECLLIFVCMVSAAHVCRIVFVEVSSGASRTMLHARAKLPSYQVVTWQSRDLSLHSSTAATWQLFVREAYGDHWTQAYNNMKRRQ